MYQTSESSVKEQSEFFSEIVSDFGGNKFVKDEMIPPFEFPACNVIWRKKSLNPLFTIMGYKTIKEVIKIPPKG